MSDIDKRLLVTIYGEQKKDKQPIALSQAFITTKEQAQQVLSQVVESMPKEERRKRFKRYFIKPVHKVRKDIAPPEVLANAHPLEIPREDRLEHFGDDIVKSYNEGTSLYKLAKAIRVSIPKLREFLLQRGASIRSRGRAPKQS